MFETLLTSLNAYLQDLDACVDFVAETTKCRSRVAGWLAWNLMGATDRELVDRFLRLPGIRTEVLCGSLYVGAYAGYEQCVAEMIIKAVDSVSDSCAAYACLPESWRTQNIYRSGQALATIMQPSQSHPFNYDDLARNLGTCSVGSTRVALNSPAFIIYRGSLDSNSLSDLLKRIGVALSWDSVAKNPDLKAAFPTLSGVRDRAKAIRGYLDDMVARRNRLAHWPASASDVSIQILLEQTAFIRALCSGLACELTTCMAKILEEVKATRQQS